MSDTPDTPATPEPEAPAETADTTDWKAEAEKWQSLSRKNEERAKTNATAARDLERLRTESLSEVEKAVEEARSAGRAEASSVFGARLVRSAYEAAAARRNPSFPTDGVIDDLNMARFVTDDGEPDLKAIEASVLRLIPETPGAPSFDGGARTTPPAQVGMSGLIRQAAGRA